MHVVGSRHIALPFQVQVLYAKDNVAIIEGLNNEADVGTCLAFSSGALGCAPRRGCCIKPGLPAFFLMQLPHAAIANIVVFDMTNSCTGKMTRYWHPFCPPPHRRRRVQRHAVAPIRQRGVCAAAGRR